MQQSPELINTDERSEFSDEAEQGNIGQLKEVRDLFLQTEVSQAATLNSAIDVQNIIEQNKKTVNNVLLDAAVNRHDTITSGDSLTLYEIAHQLAIQGGEAVYWARGKLKLDIMDHLPALRKAKQNDLQKQNHGNLFPVPAIETVTYTYEKQDNSIVELILSDMVGKKLEIYSLEAPTLTFTVKNLPSGLYYLKVLKNKQPIEEHKITIIR